MNSKILEMKKKIIFTQKGSIPDSSRFVYLENQKLKFFSLLSQLVDYSGIFASIRKMNTEKFKKLSQQIFQNHPTFLKFLKPKNNEKKEISKDLPNI